MSVATPLQPTLWRTCRVIANRTRLQIFSLLLRQPDQTVSALAGRLDLSLPLASQYLRALEARGLLKARRAGRKVEYRLRSSNGDEVSRLAEALRRTFQRKTEPVETVFRLATAFTHPRRIEIFRAIHLQPRTLTQLQSATHISGWALARHLRKLEARHFVACRQGFYFTVGRTDVLGRELARLASR
jgi:DNA-binding transcriptional ArsR family regulator